MLRPRAQADAWTAADLPLIDEAEALVKGGPRRFGHVVVDEAQDLSPMQLRMLARRARGQSMTVLGDLAQATGPASPPLLGRDARAPRPAGPRRVRGAHDRLPAARCDPRPRQPVAPVRRGRRRAVAVGARRPATLPTSTDFAPDELADAVAEHAFALAKEMATVAVIADDGHVAELRAALEARGVVLAEPGEVSPDHPLVVVPAGLAKGLEFDAVIVVEPAVIAAHEPHGVRLLFVALTARGAAPGGRPQPRVAGDVRAAGPRLRSATYSGPA